MDILIVKITSPCQMQIRTRNILGNRIWIDNTPRLDKQFI